MSSVLAAAPVVIGGAVQTTANTTAAGLRTPKRKTAAKKIRNTLVRRAPLNAPAGVLLVRKIFKFRGQLANPSTVVEPADKPRVALVASHVQELLLRDECPQPGQVGICGVAHDPTDDAGELAPLAFGKRLPVARNRDQQRRRVGKECRSRWSPYHY